MSLNIEWHGAPRSDEEVEEGPQQENEDEEFEDIVFDAEHVDPGLVGDDDDFDEGFEEMNDFDDNEVSEKEVLDRLKKLMET